MVDIRKYRQLVGSLIFLCNTSLDICFAVNVVSRFSNKLKETHWKAALCVLNYIVVTLNYGIFCQKLTNFTIVSNVYARNANQHDST